MVKEDLNEEVDDFSDDELIIRKKKAPEMRTDVTVDNVLKTAAESLETLRSKKPIVQCMTNSVVTNLSAATVQALGASPLVIEDIGEASQSISFIGSLLVNVGTVTKTQAEAMRAAVSHANMGSKPWVLDPVGVGYLPLRTFTTKELMRRFPAIICASANEINFLVTNELQRISADEVVMQGAPRLAGVTRAAVLVKDATKDSIAAEGTPIVVIEKKPLAISASVVGVSSLQATIGAAFLGALGVKARWESAIAASIVTAIACEKAAAQTKGPGSFMSAFLDALYAITPNDILKCGKVKILNA